MLTNESKETINALTHEDLIEEINKGNRSRFQGDNFAYLKTRLVLLEKQKNERHAQQQLSLDAESNQIAKEANELAREANGTSKSAYRMSVLSVVVAIVAALIALLPQCTTKPY